MNYFYQRFAKRILLTLLLVHLVMLNFAVTYYVSNSGNDSKSGLTTSSPWASLAKVNASSFNPGDQILFQRGSTFYGSLTVKNSGAAGNPITFGAYGTGDNPVITGFTTVNSWISLGNNIWESTNAVSTLPTCNMVTVNGINTPMGRYPNSDRANGGYLTFQSHSGKTSITSSNLTGTPNYTGAEIVIRSSRFTFERRVISLHARGSIDWITNTNYEPENGFGFFIQNDSKTLDQGNEWYFNSSNKKIQIYSTVKPTDVKVASIDNLVTIAASYLKVENISFKGSNKTTIYGDIHGSVYNGNTIKSCSFSNIGTSAIGGSKCNNFLIDSNTIIDSNTSAINASYASGITVKNNTVENIGVYAGMGNGINAAISTTTSCNVLFEYNRIINVGLNGIVFYADSITVKNNYIDTFCTLLDDGGGIYTYTGPRPLTESSIINGNICINGIGASEGTNGAFASIAAGIYLDEKTNGVKVYDNTIANCSEIGLFFNGNTNINAHNNTVYNASKYQIRLTAWGNRQYAVCNNKFVSKHASQRSIYINSGTDDIPLKITAENNCYASPFGTTKMFEASQPSEFGGGLSSKTLSEWKKFSSQDVNSLEIHITNVNDLRFEYNDTKVPKTINIDQPMMDVRGTKYYGKLILQPFTSVVLIKDSKTPLTTTEYKTICEGTNYNGWIASGKYERKEVSVSGDYALVTTFLTVTPVQKITENNTIYEGEEYQGWKQAGTYTRKLSSVAGCDSIVTTTLQVVLNSTKQADIESTQTIKLVKGYNLISTYVVASNPDASDVTKSLSNQNLLVKLQDEAGNSLENWGSYGGWINQLGDLENTEGYKIQVTDDCTLQVTGRPINLPLAISLKTGWNIISFPCINLVNAMNVIQPLIDQNILVKVQDEAGNSIEDWGLFGGWENGIGNFAPGKAYKVQLKADAILTIQENYPKSAVILAQTENAEYFTTRIEGNGTDHMNINIAGLSIAGIAVGDELAAFDGDICVGSVKITDAILSSSLVGIIASYSTDEKIQNGFKADNPIQIYVWNKLSGEKFKVNVDVIKGQLNFEKNASVFIQMKSLSTAVTNLSHATKVDVFPNPSNGLLTVRFSELHDNESVIDILDISGRKVASRLVTQSSEVFNLEEQAPGLYLLKTTISSKEEVHKIIIN